MKCEPCQLSHLQKYFIEQNDDVNRPVLGPLYARGIGPWVVSAEKIYKAVVIIFEGLFKMVACPFVSIGLVPVNSIRKMQDKQALSNPFCFQKEVDHLFRGMLKLSEVPRICFLHLADPNLLLVDQGIVNAELQQKLQAQHKQIEEQQEKLENSQKLIESLEGESGNLQIKFKEIYFYLTGKRRKFSPKLIEKFDAGIVEIKEHLDKAHRFIEKLTSDLASKKTVAAQIGKNSEKSKEVVVDLNAQSSSRQAKSRRTQPQPRGISTETRPTNFSTITKEREKKTKGKGLSQSKRTPLLSKDPLLENLKAAGKRIDEIKAAEAKRTENKQKSPEQIKIDNLIELKKQFEFRIENADELSKEECIKLIEGFKITKAPDFFTSTIESAYVKDKVISVDDFLGFLDFKIGVLQRQNESFDDSAEKLTIDSDILIEMCNDLLKIVKDPNK